MDWKSGTPTVFSKSKISRNGLCLAGASIAGTASAVPVVVDIADATVVTFSHLGADQWSLSAFKGSSFAFRNDLFGGGDIGVSSGGIGFTQGGDFTPSSISYFSTFIDSSGTGFDSGAAPNLNYARLDLDENSVYETVVEFDFGPDFTFPGDVITRYVYDDTGASLSISDGAAALGVLAGPTVPEPSTTVPLFLALLVGIGVRRFRKKKNA